MPTDTEHTTFGWCDVCGNEIYTDEHYHYCPSCGDYRCEDCGDCPNYHDYSCDCGDCDECRDSRIHSWDYRPSSFKPKGNYPHEVLMGVELEIGRTPSVIADTVGQIDPNENHLYLKDDGSITGAEIVTHPMTLQWAREWQHCGNAFDHLLSELRANFCSVDYSYGLHVHVSRNAFRQAYQRREVYYHRRYVTEQVAATHQLTWLLFIYRNQRQLEILARRNPSRWAAFEPMTAQQFVRKAKAVSSDDRYVAVNCNNERTYELRFFASTLDSEEFWTALEFADASVEYTRGLKSRDILKSHGLRWESFVRWVESKDYPNLLAQVRRLGIATAIDPNQTGIEV